MCSNHVKYSISFLKWALLHCARTESRLLLRDVGTGGARERSLPDSGISINHIPSKEGRLCPPHYYSSLQIFGHFYDPVAQRRKLALFGLSSRIYEDILRTKNTQKNASFCYGCSCYCLFLLWLNSPKTPFLCSVRSLRKLGRSKWDCLFSCHFIAVGFSPGSKAFGEVNNFW